jgi:hypothetical protein
MTANPVLNDTCWKVFFEGWPAELARRGVLVTSFGEQIPFSDFRTGPGLLLVERQTPDAIGARQVVVRYGTVDGIKMIDVAKPGAWERAGFASRR